MPSKYELMSQVAAEKALGITSGADRYLSFLETAAANYKYTFREQLLIYAQKPEATACAEISTWNRLGRWVNKGTKGIALLVEAQDRYRLRYVFDVSDTNSRQDRPVNLWQLQPRYENAVIVALENSFGPLDEKPGFVSSLTRITDTIVEDNFTDYAEMLRSVKAGSLLEELDDQNLAVWLKSTVKSGVAFMALTRCGYDARQYFDANDFPHLYDFNTYETVSVLGGATSDMAEMALREIEVTVKALQREDKTQNRTFANPDQARDNARETNERSDEHGTDLSTGGRLSAAQRDGAGEPPDWEIWNAAARFPAEAPRPDLHRDAAGRDAEQPSRGDRPDGQRDAGSADLPDVREGGRDGTPESLGSDAVGPEDEQHSEPGGGDRAGGADLPLTDVEDPEVTEEEPEQSGAVLEMCPFDYTLPSGIDYYYHDAEKQELLRTCERLNDHRPGIAAYFAVHADRKDRGNFVKWYFNNTFIEQILSNGQRVGYRAYDDVLHIWRGAYLTREHEVFLRWEAVADAIYGMMLMEEWLAPEERPLPTEGEQIALMEQAETEKDTAFTMPQAAIDYILAGGSGVFQGKFRIYEQFQKGESVEENVKFLRNEYGTGGRSDAIPGTGIWEDHDSKGITLRKSLSGEDKDQTVILRWPKVEKRIRELIEADRYLNDAEKAAYPKFLRSQEVRAERRRIAEEFRQIIGDYKDYVKDTNTEDKLTDRWYLASCASAFTVAEKKMFARTADGDFILPMMREAMETIISEDTPFTERCRKMLEDLSGPLALGLEPTYEELHPPKKEYRISNGDTVYLGAQEYEVIFMGTEQVVVSDAKFPLMQQEYSREDFLRMVSENPMNSRYQHIVEEPEAEPVSAPEGDAASLDRAKSLINDFCLREYGVEGDYDDLTRVGIGYTTVEDTEIPIQVYVDLVNFRLERYSEDHLIDRRQYDSLEALIEEELQDLDFSELMYLSDEQIEDAERAFNAPPQTDDSRFIAHYYVVPDLQTQGQLAVQTFPAFEEAFSVYVALPTTQLKALGVQNTKPMPGSLDFIQCRDGKDYLVEDYTKVDGWDSPEITELVNEIQKRLRDRPDQEQAPESRVDEMLQQAMLAAELSEQTGQNVFAFEEGNPQPVNVPAAEQPEQKEERAEKEITPPPTARPRERLAPSVLHPEVPSDQRHDYRITDDSIGVGTPLDRFYQNIRAIQLLKKLESEQRLAAPTEQSVLAEYVGWGGLPQFFEESNPHYSELKAVLTDEEYASARESSLTAFYTPPIVIRAMYQALENIGFKNGNILEPSCGVGNFMGMKPESLSDSRIYGVELDSISGRIAQQLYQNSSIAVQGFEKTELPDSFFDVAIGNIPFGNFKLVDSRYNKHNFLIHDYFFAKALDKVRPGGIVTFVTSKGTMDKESPVVRKYIAQRADLLGAIRLPNDTFKSAAGTDVTSDILFLQKRDTLTVEEPAWVHLNTDENGLKMNQYFIDNPDMVLGEMREISGPFGPETACVPFEVQDLEDLLSGAIQNITGSITEYDLDDLAEEEEDNSIPADPSVRNFSYTVVDGKVYYRENSRMVPVDLSVTAENRVKGLIEIRDTVRTLIEYQTEDYSDDMISAQQKLLNEQYDAFSAKYGSINSRANKSAFRADNSFFLLSSLEVLDDEGNFVRKADMFTKRTIRQRVEITHVDTATEALAVSLAEKARVDMDFMAELTGKSEEELFSDLKGVVFLNPMFGYANSSEQKYLPADEYLSGNVREKLAWARRSAELSPEDFGPNVVALEAVQPKDLSAAEISVRIGSTWIPPEDYADFMFELFDTPNYCQWNIKVHFSQYTGEWNIEGKSYDRSSVKAHNTYGTERINGYKIMEQTLNLKDVRIFDYVEDENGNRKPVLNKKETAIAQAKQEQIKQAFQDWIWKDQTRRERLCQLYNEKFNAIRPREYDGSHLTLPGMNPEISLRPHQLNAVARGLYGGNELLGHVVGAGKTFTMVAIAQESKRLGLCQKSLIVVPNHLTEQWATEYLQLYPSANILVATAKDFETKNRKRFCGRIATGEYDAVIIGHSQLEKIPLSFGRQVYYLEQQREEILAGIAEMKENRGDRFSIKQLERTKKQVDAKLDKLNDQSRKDDIVTFEELGIDRLFIDEAHSFKNLAAFSKMRNVGGISQTEAQKSSDLYMKIRYMDELTGGRGVCFATGTPISNTMVEMYTMQKYLQYDTLRQNGLIHFDAWASTFGETVTAIELAPEGTGYRAKTRFARFFNLPELMAMFKEVADIQTADMLNLPVPQANFHTVALKPSEFQVEMVEGLAERAEKVRNGMVNSSQDNMLVITNDGRKLALDQRLINPMLPESETGKVAVCAQNVFSIWQRTADQRSTQMIFCDLSTPHNDGSFNVYDAIRDKLIAMGIPAEEIAYIHSAGTEAKKKELFGKVRSGQIRVLIGSTQKMGAGTNVQRKLIALHHLDCPWRPADLQQREGRIIRQGNENPEVEIYTYVTENTFDAYLYQLVESKQKFIGQIMTSKSPVRSAEDIDETALSYAEIKALCSGNPAVKEKMDLDVAVAKLKLLKANHLSQIYSLEHDITHRYPRQIKEAEQMIEGYQKDITHRDENTKPNEDGFSPMVIQGETFTEKKAAGSALLEECHNMKSPDPVPLGQYRGFAVELYFETASKEFRLTLSHTLRHTVSLGSDIHGNIQRIDNVLDGLEARIEGQQESLKHVESQLVTAKEEAQRPFPQEDELKEKQARLDQLNIELNMDQRENDLLDDDRGDGGDTSRDNNEHER